MHAQFFARTEENELKLAPLMHSRRMVNAYCDEANNRMSTMATTAPLLSLLPPCKNSAKSFVCQKVSLISWYTEGEAK